MEQRDIDDRTERQERGFKETWIMEQTGMDDGTERHE